MSSTRNFQHPGGARTYHKQDGDNTALRWSPHTEPIPKFLVKYDLACMLVRVYMYLVQLLLPLYDNNGRPLPRERFEQTRAELVARFGGLTAYARSPATGVWQPAPDDSPAIRDEIIIYEIMSKHLDPAWWKGYRIQLEQRFSQEKLLVRASPIELL